MRIDIGSIGELLPLTLVIAVTYMTPIKAVITGVQGYVPDFVLSNALLETMVDTSDEWIKSRTGIEERRILKEPGKATSDMASRAVLKLLEKTGTNADEVELLICATVTADMVFPDTANTICDKIGAKKAWGFDLNAACSGFLFALSTGASFIESGRYRKVVVVGADMMSSIIDYTDRTTCVIFGDGAGAVLLEPSTSGFGVIDSVFHGDGSGGNTCIWRPEGRYIPPVMRRWTNGCIMFSRMASRSLRQLSRE